MTTSKRKSKAQGRQTSQTEQSQRQGQRQGQGQGQRQRQSPAQGEVKHTEEVHQSPKDEHRHDRDESHGHHCRHHKHYPTDWRSVCFFHELEDWRKDNPWIVTGYRLTNYSYITCLKTLFFIHNETGNVLSHLLGGVLFIYLAFDTHINVLPTWWDQMIFGFFMICAIGCLLLSAFFHLFSCHSHPVSLTWNKCDYVGIMLMIVGSFYPSVYYAFHCTPELQLLYLVTMSIFGLACVPVMVMDRFATTKYRFFRTWLFVGLGCSGVFPIIHGIYLYTWEIAQHAGGLNWTLTMGALYLVGAFLYANQIPERYWPGKFDLWFHSHQIMHLCVLFAAIIHYIGLMKAFDWHISHPCHVEPHWHSPVIIGNHSITHHITS